MNATTNKGEFRANISGVNRVVPFLSIRLHPVERVSSIRMEA